MIEERLPGVEASVFAFCDGEHVLMTIPACDYKRALDGGRGPEYRGHGQLQSARSSSTTRRWPKSSAR